MTRGSAGTKNILLRLDPELAERLRAVADVEGRPVSEVVREAIAGFVEARQQDERFVRKLDESLERHRRTLDLLRPEPGDPSDPNDSSDSSDPSEPSRSGRGER